MARCAKVQTAIRSRPAGAAIRHPQSALPKIRDRCKCSEIELCGPETALKSRNHEVASLWDQAVR
eukprot:11470693-Alexandrium_andersonii.AAC.1